MKFEIVIASAPDRDDLVAEIWWGDELVAELNREAIDTVQIEIFARVSHEPWRFELADWLAAITQAEQSLARLFPA